MDIWSITIITIFLIVFATIQITLSKMLSLLEEINNKLNYVKRGDKDNG